MKKTILRAGLSLTTIRAIAIIGIVFAAPLLYYDWTVTMTGASPKIFFHKWATPFTNATTIDLTYNVYADLWLIDTNATYGIMNNDTAPKTVYMWVESTNMTTPTDWFANFTVQIRNETGDVLQTWTTTDFASLGEGTQVSWTADANGIKIDTIKVLFKGGSDVVVGEAVKVSLKLKTAE
jgi:hypothetical protein